MKFRSIPFLQPISWTLVLVVLYFIDRDSTNNSLCIFRVAGIENCPGCGIGHAISEALHFNFYKSFDTHITGIPSAFFLIVFIIRTFISSIKQTDHGPETANDAAKSST